jgi:hypothetical protein
VTGQAESGLSVSFIVVAVECHEDNADHKSDAQDDSEGDQENWSRAHQLLRISIVRDQAEGYPLDNGANA